MDWDGEPLKVRMTEEEPMPNLEAPPIRRRRYWSAPGLYDLHRMLLLLLGAASLIGVILGDIWLWGHV